ncbi:GNAT family N-acetyltransferase [Actinomadura kijaniata]|uniref:GNAT family N-acetyltransferase n=1 Tax=Actinomadura kijaniata TaxID=46161 RepID=UPI0008377E3C|nr:GNAT family N-acetyltransferase [Actinomadura kijaniata]
MDLTVRSLTLDDLDACLALAVSRDWPPDRDTWRSLFALGSVYGVDAPGDGLLATAAGTSYGAATTAVGMVLTAPSHERRGLGGRLMRHVLAESGTPSAWLTATTFGRPLYERLGFRAVGGMSTLRGVATLAPSGRSRPAAAGDLPAIRALDAAAFGAPRERLLDHLSGFCLSWRVVETAKGIAGFGGAWRNHEETVLGPVVADDLATATSLLADLAADTPGPHRAEVDHRRPELLAWLERAGLTTAFTTTVMEYGPPLPSDPSKLFTAASLALG